MAYELGSVKEAGSMEERRRERRVAIDGQGFFLQDGILSEIKIRDRHSRGIGGNICRELKAGQQGVLMVHSPLNPEMEEVPSEVCWCVADPGERDSVFPYRVGLRLLA